MWAHLAVADQVLTFFFWRTSPILLVFVKQSWFVMSNNCDEILAPLGNLLRTLLYVMLSNALQAQQFLSNEMHKKDLGATAFNSFATKIIIWVESKTP